MNYDKAVEELKSIIQELQNGSTNIDQLATKAKRAAELIELCKDKLRDTEEAVESLFKPEESK